MEKLIELLNEYDAGMVSWYEEYFSTEGLFVTNAGQGFREEFILGKRYGFIKWLVENDKIDLKKLDEAERRPMYVTDDMFSLYKIDECVIMLLAISENPIDDLISYLK